MNSPGARSTLGDVCIAPPQYGFTASASTDPIGPHFIRTTDIVGGSLNWASVPYCEIPDSDKSKYLVQDGDILISRMGTVGVSQFIINSRPAVFASYLVRFRPDPEKVFPQYLKYQLLSPNWWRYVDSVKTGSVQPNLNARLMSSYEFTLPTLNEQRRIAGVLGALDDLIEVNRGLMDHLRSLITAVYQRMMNKMKPPDRPIFDVFEIDFGAAFKGSAFSEPGVGLPLLRIRDLKTFSPGTWTTERVKGDVIVSAGDVVVGMDAEFRPTFWIGPESLLNQRVCRVRSRVGGNAFVRESLVKPLAFIEGHKTGTTVSHLNKADLLEVSIPVPDATALAQFDEISEPLLKALVLLSQEIDELVATRDELLPLLMSGRVRVGEAGVAA